MASRCEATTAIRGMTCASANASSSWVRVVVPAGAVTSGKPAKVAIAMVWRRGAPGRQHREQILALERMAREVAGADRLGGDPELAFAARDQIDDGGGVARIGEGDVDARMGDPERTHQRRHRVDRQGGECGEVEAPGRQPGHGLDRGAAGLDVAQHLAGRFDQGLAGRGQHDPTADAVEQRGAELGLELTDRLRDRGLGDVLGLGGAGHPPVVDHGQEQAELPEIHRYSL